MIQTPPPTSSSTAWTIGGNVCLISGKCYLAKQVGATACDVCTPAKSKTAWSLGTGPITGNRIDMDLYEADDIGFLQPDLPGDDSVELCARTMETYFRFASS